jgi:predicted  nucleic acid-binding Zn-ribbon protein
MIAHGRDHENGVLNYSNSDDGMGADPIEDFQVLSHASVNGVGLNEVALSVPLPLDIPPPPNLSSLPAHILHSGTVETLIGQSEDLMARLKVNIRRNSILEQQIMEQDRLHARLKYEHASLVAQYQVLEEKSEMIREKAQTFDIQTEELREQIILLEARVEAAEERSHELRAGLAFENAYRRRIRSWVRPYINEVKARLNEFSTRVSFLDRQLATREAVIGDLRERLAVSEKINQTQTVTNNQDQALLIQTYESRIRFAEIEMSKARTESALLRDKAAGLDDAISARANAENKIVSLERRNQEIEQTLTEELKAIQSQLTEFRVEAKELAAEVMTATSERDRAKASEVEAISELQRARDQFESLQAVWAEAQKKFEASRLQQESLNKLNQELSRQMKIERKAREITPEAVAPAPQLEVSSHRIQKIDSLLAELESGFSKARGQEHSGMNGLDFIEDQSPEGVIPARDSISPLSPI